MSLRVLPRGATIGPTSSVMPRTSATLTTFEPSASPSAISGFSAAAAPIATETSGVEVAKAATVAPITPAGTRSQAAIPTAARTNSSPPAAAQTSPAVRATASDISP
jgi:hypothetical protein